MKTIKTLALVLPIALSACSKNHASNSNASTGGSPVTVNGNTPPSLAGKSFADVMAAKYDSAKLVCRLWTRMGSPIFISNTPSDEASLDLKSVKVPQSLKLSATDGIHSASAIITVTDLDLQDGGSVSSSGVAMTFENSPVVTATVVTRSGTMYPGGYVGGGGQGSPVDFAENSSAQLMSESEGPTDTPTTYSVDYATCTVETKIKPAYASEWQQTSKGSAQTCYMTGPGQGQGCLINAPAPDAVAQN